jgi:CxxC-x17-CxxC domain-containing protein
MSFAEKLLQCNNCKKNFTFTVESQQNRSSQGYPNDPVMCPACRRARKTYSSKETSTDGVFNPNRQMFPVTCTQCGKAVRVPFQPHPGKPVYCSECQMKTRFGR